MTPQQLLDAYPTVKHAISYTEIVVHYKANYCRLPCGLPCGLTPWDVLMLLPPECVNPQEVVNIIATGVEGALGDRFDYKVILEEMRKPEYLTYIRGKMGAV